MRVAFVCTQDRGGPVDLTVGLARELAGRAGGPEVAIAGPPPLTSAGDVTGLIRPVHVRSKTDARGGRELRRVLAAFDPDLVHAQDKRAALAATTVARGAAPVVATYHGVLDGAAGWWVRKGPLAGRRPTAGAAAVLAADALVARLTAATVAPSNAMAEFLRQRLRVPAGKLHTIANGVRLPPVNLPTGPARTFISVSTFAPAKATGVVVEAFAAVARSRPGLRLVLVGDGLERAGCERRATALGIDHLVEFTGYRTDVPQLLAKTDCFVLASVNENLPLALMEAMGAGLACVASQVGGVAELLDRGVGLLVEPGDPHTMARAMAALADQPQLARGLGSAAARTARRRCSIGTCADAHLALWSRLLNGGPR
jgi:glycosyltransferase involved in cell wall biosynthesis